MRDLKTSRTALGLYGALLVLPTLILGWMYWCELEAAYEQELADIPQEASDVARRIVSAMSEQLTRLVEAEARRPFTDYSEYVIPDGALGDELRFQQSPTTQGIPPEGVLAWFRFARKISPDSDVSVFVGDETYGRSGAAERFIPIVEDYRLRKDTDDVLRSVSEAQGPSNAFPLAAVALYMRGADLDCVRQCEKYMDREVVYARVSDFKLQFYVDDQGRPRAIASRRIRAAPLSHFEDMPAQASCLAILSKGFWLQQGFFIDVDWLFKELPFRIEEHILDSHQSLVRASGGAAIDDIDSVFASIDPVEELGFETFDPSDDHWGRLEVKIDTKDIDRRFETQARNLLVVGTMLVLTLLTGMTLLYRSVNRELEHAHRMQNFVAAVTHELRTPVSTIRVYGEMLADGWVTDPEKQREYYERIVRETGRLSTLVENVLEKSRLKESVTKPEPGDLNQRIEALRERLEGNDDKDDLAFELAPRLPQVWLTDEGVTGILTNLVENARKYAPVSDGGEPILVRTRWDGERALLEVSDRGPGVPKSERDRIFEAFYRVGSEATRTTTGTGLGLHLVKLHADAAGAIASVHAREGGGTIFRVAWRAVS